MSDRTRARFPGLDPAKGHYESFYLKTTAPEGRLGLWIRQTIHRRPGHPATAAVWVTLFDAAADGPVATKLTVREELLSFPTGSYLRVGGADLGPTSATGVIATPGLNASWDLRLADEPGADAFHHLPLARLYDAPLPRTKLLSPHPAIRVSGRAVIGGRLLTLDGWPGMVGHNWGAEHAETWTWIQAGPLAGAGRGLSYFDLGAGRIKIRALTTPWIANAMLVVDGEPLRLGGLTAFRSTRFTEGAPGGDVRGASFALAGRGVGVRGRVEAAAKDFVAWVYADPSGSEHHSVNCSISDLELKVERPGVATTVLRSAGSAAYELGTRNFGHGVPVQPFPDGESG